jgi:hypothetical protein
VTLGWEIGKGRLVIVEHSHRDKRGRAQGTCIAPEVIMWLPEVWGLIVEERGGVMAFPLTSGSRNSSGTDTDHTEELGESSHHLAKGGSICASMWRSGISGA